MSTDRHPSPAVRIAAVVCALHGAAAVAAGAFGAHGAGPETADLFETGAKWQVVGGLAGLAASWRGATLALWLFMISAGLFAGSLYALALGAPTLVAYATPIGGLGLIIAFLVLAWRVARAG